MCDSGLDPKFMMRDIEARMMSVRLATVGNETPEPARWPGVMALLRVARDVLRRKDSEHA
jgi:hypothetical protein